MHVGRGEVEEHGTTCLVVAGDQFADAPGEQSGSVDSLRSRENAIHHLVGAVKVVLSEVVAAVVSRVVHVAVGEVGEVTRVESVERVKSARFIEFQRRQFVIWYTYGEPSSISQFSKKS